MSRAPSFLTLPNLLSLSRFPLAVAFVLAGGEGVRLALIGAASLTDLLDGWLARHAGRATIWGALLDPIADKTFVLAALSTFLFRGELLVRDYFILLLRDFATAIGFVVAYLTPWLEPEHFKARWAGKVVTALQLVALLVVVVTPDALRWLVPVIGVLSVVAIADYTLALARSRVA